MLGMPNSLLDGCGVVTGAGSGLGRALAIELTRRGLPVIGLGPRGETLQQTAALIGSGRFTFHVLDVADEVAVAAAFADIATTSRPLTVLINNAAIYERFDLLAQPPARTMHAVAVNLGGVVNCCYHALRLMTRTGFGRIVNVTTFADIAPLSGSAAYSVSKGAARIYSRALVADLADRFPEIVVSDWVPGALATPMGLPDGLPPETAAVWGAELALRHDPALNGVLFDQDREILAPRSKKQRLKDLLLLRRPAPPRSLGGL